MYAHWNNGNSYTVSFDGNGGTASSASKKVTYGGTYGDLPSGSKTGYTLKGWFTAKSSGTQVTSGAKISTASDHTLYAQWTANQYNIIEFLKYGTLETLGSSMNVDTDPVKLGEKIVADMKAKRKALGWDK